jgi:hypothetical protein
MLGPEGENLFVQRLAHFVPFSNRIRGVEVHSHNQRRDVFGAATHDVQKS